MQLNKPSHWMLKNLMCAIIFVVNALILMSNSAFGASPLHNLLYRRPLGSDVYDGDSKTMLIFLDDYYENNFFTRYSVIAKNLAVALYQPFVCTMSSQSQGQYSIVASAALVRMLLSFKALGEPLYGACKQHLQSLAPDCSVEGYEGIETTKVNWSTYVIMDWMRKFKLSQQWQMYLFKDDGLVLFVPLTNQPKEDIVLGLGVSALNAITELELQNYLAPGGFGSDLNGFLNTRWESPKESGTGLFNVLPQLFMTNQKYKNTLARMPQWTIYMHGHGFAGSNIVAMFFDDFKKILTFFEQKILVRGLIISTCGAAGLSADNIYGDKNQLYSRIPYSFPIIIETLADMLSFVGPIGQLFQEKIYNPRVKLNFLKFAGCVQDKKPIPYAQVLPYIFTELPSGGYIDDTSSLPQIRLAYREDFKPMVKIVEINSVMADTRTVPLSIISAWRKKKDWTLAIPEDSPHLLINTAYIPFVLDLGGLKTLSCRMYSNMSGESSHILEGIQMPHEQCELNVLVEKVANMFTFPAAGDIAKRFLIKSLWTEQAGTRELPLATDVLVIASRAISYGYTASRSFVHNISDTEYRDGIANINATVLHRSQVDCTKFNFYQRAHMFEKMFRDKQSVKRIAAMYCAIGFTAAAVGYIYRRSVASASRTMYS